jgi:hypothetical protein
MRDLELWNMAVGVEEVYLRLPPAFLWRVCENKNASM